MEDSEVKVFDPDGDVRLLVFDHSTSYGAEPVQMTFLISSKVMSLASDVWKAMFNGHFKEAQPSANREVSLPDDDARALEVLLNIAHLRYELVPEKLSFSKLVQVTVATDKYGATKLIRPWCKAWIDGVVHLLTKPGYEEWLWIAWELGQVEIFNTLVSHLVRETWVDENGNLRNTQDQILFPCEESLHLPEGIAESIIAVQTEAHRKLCMFYHSLLDEYIAKNLESEPICDKGCRDEQFSCDAITYGSLVFSLQRLGFPTEKSERKNHLGMSLNTFGHKIFELRLRTRDHNGSNDFCENRRTYTKIFQEVRNITRALKSPLLDMHHRHLQRQAKTLGF